MEDRDRWQAIGPVLEEFRSFLSPKVPESEIIEAADRRWGNGEYKRLRPKGFPSRLRGVYLLFDNDERLQYVGVAMWNYDKRVWSHDRHFERRFIDIIPFDDRRIFLAPALEFFLISKLDPPQNSTYKGYKIADADEDVQP